MSEQFNDVPPAGWNEWEAFLVSDAYSKDVEALINAIQSGRHLDIGLSINCVASCAFAAGLDAGHSRREQRQDDEQQPPDWPPPLVQGEPQELPGFEDVPERPAERRYPK